MLTIVHDTLFVDGKQLETATAEGVEVILPRGASCKLAALLIENGYDAEAPVRLVRADPYLFAPPHKIEDITLSTAASIDFFGEDTAADIPEAILRVEEKRKKTARQKRVSATLRHKL
ncbi:MAG: hypothetical protein AAGJ91_09885 [Pseudomonadota bacterium]